MISPSQSQVGGYDCGWGRVALLQRWELIPPFKPVRKPGRAGPPVLDPPSDADYVGSMHRLFFDVTRQLFERLEIRFEVRLTSLLFPLRFHEF